MNPSATLSYGLFIALALGQSGQSLQLDAMPVTAPDNASTAALASRDLLVRPDDAVFDFGRIPTGQPAYSTLRITNHDSVTRVLLRIQHNGMDSVKMPRELQIAPGGTVEIECSINGPARPGRVSGKTVPILCEGQPLIRVPIRAEVFSFVEIEPAAVSVGDFDEDICLRSIDNQPFRIKAVIPDCLDYVSSESKVEHQIVLNRKALYAEPTRQIILKLDHPHCKQVLLAVPLEALIAHVDPLVPLPARIRR